MAKSAEKRRRQNRHGRAVALAPLVWALVAVPAHASETPLAQPVSAPSIPGASSSVDSPSLDVASDGASPPTSPALPQGLQPPRVDTPAPVRYPRAAYDEGYEADVVCDVELNARGQVISVTPVQFTLVWYDDANQLVEQDTPVDADTWGFVDAAVRSLRETRWRPALLADDEFPEGRPIPIIVARKVSFLYDEATLDDAVAAEEDDSVEAVDNGDLAPGDASLPFDPDEEPGEAVLVDQVDPYGPVNFEGEVMERGARRFLGGVRVTAYREPDGPRVEAVTQPDGRFSFRGLPPGRYYVLIDDAEFKVFEAYEEVSSTDVASVRYRIEREYFDAYRSQTVEEPPAREATRRTLDVQEIQRIPGTNNDALRAVQNLPGVARAPFAGGEIIVRGSESSDSGFYVDGMPIPTLYHFGALRAVIPTELIDSLDFYPGNFGARYGRASAGVLELETSLRHPEDFGGHFDINLFDAGIFVEGPINEKLAFQVGFRRSYIDSVLLAARSVLPVKLSVAPRYYDYQARLLWKINDAHRASFLVYGSDDLVELVLEKEEDLDPEVRGGFRSSQAFHAFQVRLDSTLSSSVEHTLRIQAAWQGTELSAGDRFFIDYRFWRLALRDEFKFKVRDNFLVRAGLDAQVLPINVSFQMPNFSQMLGQETLDFEADDAVVVSRRVSSFEPAVYVEADWRPIEGLQIIPGIRADYFSLVSQASVDGRLAARYTIHDRATVKAAVGNYHRSPDSYELINGFGNPQLGLEHVIQYSAGAEFSLLDYLSFDVEFFYKDMRQLVSATDRLTMEDGEAVRMNYSNGGRGRVYGAEFFLRHKLANNFFGWLTYTISRSERLDDGKTQWHPFDYDQTHILSLLGTYYLPKNWSIGARFRLVSGNLSTPVVGAVYNSDADSYNPVYGELNSERQPFFHQLDLRVDKRWIFHAWNLNLYLDIQNLYNRQNPEGYIYSYDYSNAQRVSGLPFIPSFGIRGEF